MEWKSFLKALLAVVLPLLYSLLLKWAPDLPIPEAQFIELIIWAVGLLIGGWQLSNSQKLKMADQIGETKIAGRFFKEI